MWAHCSGLASLCRQLEDDDVFVDEDDDVFVDEDGCTWTRPTAWAYAQAIKALANHVVNEEILRRQLEALTDKRN